VLYLWGSPCLITLLGCGTVYLRCVTLVPKNHTKNIISSLNHHKKRHFGNYPTKNVVQPSYHHLSIIYDAIRRICALSAHTIKKADTPTVYLHYLSFLLFLLDKTKLNLYNILKEKQSCVVVVHQVVEAQMLVTSGLSLFLMLPLLYSIFIKKQIIFGYNSRLKNLCF
jgi:hypothetical protein